MRFSQSLIDTQTDSCGQLQLALRVFDSFCNCTVVKARRSIAVDRVPTPPGKSWIFFLKIPGPGKSWKLKLKVLESPGKISLQVMHFSSGSNGKQAAIV